MRLYDWRKQEGYSQQQLAAALQVTQPTVSVIERWGDRDNPPQIPQPDLMRRIYALTRGAVAPNDFYDLPPIGQLELQGMAPADGAPLLAAAAGDQ